MVARSLARSQAFTDARMLARMFARTFAGKHTRLHPRTLACTHSLLDALWHELSLARTKACTHACLKEGLHARSLASCLQASCTNSSLYAHTNVWTYARYNASMLTNTSLFTRTHEILHALTPERTIVRKHGHSSNYTASRFAARLHPFITARRQACKHAGLYARSLPRTQPNMQLFYARTLTYWNASTIAITHCGTLERFHARTSKCT
jgi:hypothetical protein